MAKRIGNHFEIQEMIGQGGMGEVFRGVDTRTGESVAIKALKPEIIESDPFILERFEREGEALRKLNHPSIVKVLAALDESNEHYLVMEYVSGGSLWDLLKKEGALAVERVLEIALDLADALTRAHRLKIIHRDIKPQNVLLSEDGTPRLTDFGVAHMGDRSRVTQTGSLVGTYSYLSPEACNGEILDERADIWAFGVMLFEMLTGRRPFEAEQPAALILAIISKPVPDLAALRPDAPPALVSLVYRMLEKDREQRIASVRLVGAEIEALLAKREITPAASSLPDFLIPPVEASRFATPTPTAPPNLFASTPLSSAVTPPATLPAAPSRSMRGLLTGVVLLLVLLLVGTIFLFTREEPAEEERVDANTTVTVAPIEAGQYMVLVADLEHIGGEERDFTRFLVDDLEQTLEREAPFANIQIMRYPQVVTSAEMAQAAADTNAAPIIVWGNYSDERVEVQIQLGDLTAFPGEVIARDMLARTTEVQLHMTDIQRESVASYVAGTLLSLHAAAGDGYQMSRNLVVLDMLNIEMAAPAEQTVSAYFHQAQVNFVDDPTTSLAAIRQALDRDAGNPLLYVTEAAIQMRLDNLSAAQAALQTAQRLIGSQEWAYLIFAQANLNMLQGDFAAALDQYTRLTVLRPDDWFVWNFRAALYYILGDYDNARADYATAFILEPDMNFPYTYSTILALRAGEISQAQDYINTVITQFPDPTFSKRMVSAAFGSPDKNIFGPSIAAFMYMALGRYEESLREAEIGLAIAPSPEMYLAQGYAYCNLNQYEEAVTAFTNAIALDPDFMLLYALRGSAYVHLNDLSKALADVAVLREQTLSAEMEQMIEAGLSGDLTCKNFFTYDLN